MDARTPPPSSPDSDDLDPELNSRPQLIVKLKVRWDENAVRTTAGASKEGNDIAPMGMPTPVEQDEDETLGNTPTRANLIPDEEKSPVPQAEAASDCGSAHSNSAHGEEAVAATQEKRNDPAPGASPTSRTAMLKRNAAQAGIDHDDEGRKIKQRFRDARREWCDYLRAQQDMIQAQISDIREMQEAECREQLQDAKEHKEHMAEAKLKAEAAYAKADAAYKTKLHAYNEQRAQLEKQHDMKTLAAKKKEWGAELDKHARDRSSSELSSLSSVPSSLSSWSQHTYSPAPSNDGERDSRSTEPPSSYKPGTSSDSPTDGSGGYISDIEGEGK